MAGDAAPWAATTQALPFVRAVAVQDSVLAITLDDPDAQNPPLIQALVAAGAPIRYVEPIEHSLEDVYLELVQDIGTLER